MKKNVFYIPRELETAIELYRNSPEIIAITGTRQYGKTTLMQHIMQGIKEKRVVFLDFEDRDEANLFTSDIKAFAKLHIVSSYLFHFIHIGNHGKHSVSLCL